MRTVAYWDADRFFASVEQAADRRLRARPVAVGGASRGIVLSASPEARRLGIRPGWPMSRARHAVPALIVIPAHFELYERFFDQILGLCRETTPLVEPAAVGAAWLDLTGLDRLHPEGLPALIDKIRATVRNWLRVSLSSAIATNKLVARVAARLRKPGAHLVVPPGRERAFLAPLSLRWLPGLDNETLAALEVAGITSIGHFAAAPVGALSLLLGRNALPLQRRAQGVSEEPVGKPVPSAAQGWAESIEFAEDRWETPLLVAALRALAEKLMPQVRANSCEIRKITIEVRYTDRDESRRSIDLPEPTALDSAVLPLLPRLLDDAWTRRVRIRALTLRASRVYRPSPQMDLFSPSPRREFQLKLATTIDALRRAHGPAILRRACDLLPRSA